MDEWMTMTQKRTTWGFSMRVLREAHDRAIPKHLVVRTAKLYTNT